MFFEGKTGADVNTEIFIILHIRFKTGGDNAALTGFDEFEIKTMFTDYSNIDDLIENDFSEVDNNEKVKLTFDMSFGLPEELKEKALEYTNKNGKGVLAQAVLDFVEGN